MEFPFLIKADHRFDAIDLSNEHRKLMLLDGTPRSEMWTPIPFTMHPADDPAMRGAAVDFPFLPGGLAFSQRALEALFPLVGDKIEALPLDPRRGGAKYYAVNVLNLIDCLDENRSEIRRSPTGRIADVRKYAFHPGSTDGQHIFKLRQVPIGEVFVSAAFKRAVDEHALSGLLFTEVGAKAERERVEAGRK